VSSSTIFHVTEVKLQLQGDGNGGRTIKRACPFCGQLSKHYSLNRFQLKSACLTLLHFERYPVVQCDNLCKMLSDQATVLRVLLLTQGHQSILFLGVDRSTPSPSGEDKIFHSVVYLLSTKKGIVGLGSCKRAPFYD